MQALLVLCKLIFGFPLSLRDLHSQRFYLLTCFRLQICEHNPEAAIIVLQAFPLTTHVVLQNGHLFTECLKRILQTLVTVMMSGGCGGGALAFPSQKRELLLEYGNLGVRGSKLLRQVNSTEPSFLKASKVAIELRVRDVELMLQVFKLHAQYALIGVPDGCLKPGDLRSQ